MRVRQHRAGYTLIELMIVVAIIGILAAIAIPSFLRFQLRAKTAEAKTNIQAIRTAEASHVAETGAYVAAQISPATYGGTVAKRFVDTGPVGNSFADIGWEPEGLVYFQYVVSVAGGAYTVEAAGDLNGNAVPQIWGYVKDDVDGNTVAGALGCVGVWDSNTSMASLVNTVGPCGADYGQSEF